MGSSSGSNSNVYSKARNRVGSVTGFEPRLLFERRECGKYLKRIFPSVVGVRYSRSCIRIPPPAAFQLRKKEIRSIKGSSPID